MIEKLMTNSRVTEVDAASMRMVGAYKATTLSSDPHLAGMFTALETEFRSGNDVVVPVVPVLAASRGHLIFPLFAGHHELTQLRRLDDGHTHRLRLQETHANEIPGKVALRSQAC